MTGILVGLFGAQYRRLLIALRLDFRDISDEPVGLPQQLARPLDHEAEVFDELRMARRERHAWFGRTVSSFEVRDVLPDEPSMPALLRVSSFRSSLPASIAL